MKITSLLIIIVVAFACKKQTTIIDVKFNPKVDKQRVVEIKSIEDITAQHASMFTAYQKDMEIPAQVVLDPLTGKKSLLIYPEVKNANIEITAGKPSEFEAMAHAELWHKTGGEFINKVYTGGGEFEEVNSLRVPDSCTDHSFYIKYEGPGWESNLVGYRFYLDWRNAVDVFGKTTTDMILDGVGQDGYDSYHEMQPWGMDVLKVGNSLGVGTIAYWHGKYAERVAKTDSVFCEILSNTGLRAQIKTNYYGWETKDFKCNFTSYLSIDANSRITNQTLVFDTAPQNICTGIYIDNKAHLIELSEGDYTCLATWGPQSLNNDKLGLFIIVKSIDIIESTSDNLNHILVLKPIDNTVSWLFGAAWELEPNGINTKDKFIAYLKQELQLLNDPDEVKIKKQE